MPRQYAVLICLVGTVTLAACSQGGPPESAAETATPARPRATSTIVFRLAPPATRTPAVDPLAPVESDDLSGVVVPAGAELIDYVAPDPDARADYHMAGVDYETLNAWFRDQLPRVGWDEGKDTDGALMFLHTTQLSARYAGVGLKRTATIFFEETDEGVDFSLLVEAPEE